MAYTSKEIIKGRIVGDKQVPTLIKAGRADGTFDLILGNIDRVVAPLRWLTTKKLAGIRMERSTAGGVALGEYIISGGTMGYKVGDLTNWYLYNGDSVKHGAYSRTGIIMKIDGNPLRLIPASFSGNHWGADGNSYGDLDLRVQMKDGTQIKGAYDFNNQGLVDYKDADFLYLWAWQQDGSKYTNAQTEIRVTFLQVVPYTSWMYNYFT